MKNIFIKGLILVFTFFTFSCEKEEIILPENTVIQDETIVQRMTFESSEIFSNQIQNLEEMTTEELRAWGAVNFPNSLMFAMEEDEDIYKQYEPFNLPMAIWALTNKDGEVQVGKNIHWHYNKSIYVADSESELKDIKRNPELAKKIFLIVSKVIDLDTQDTHNKVVLGGASLDARHQKQFWKNGFWFKYVHEIFTTKYYYGDVHVNLGNYYGWISIFKTFAKMNIKLEYKGSGGWHPAGELRDLSYNLTITGHFDYLPYSGANWSINHFPTIYKSGYRQNVNDITIPLVEFGTFQADKNKQHDFYWHIEVSGNITQRFSGNNSSGTYWNNQGTPLW